MSGWIGPLIVLLLFLGAIGAALLLAGRRDRRLRQVLAREHPGSVVVTGALTAEGASTLQHLGHPVGFARSLGGGMAAVAAGPAHVELWWWDGGRAAPLLRLPWSDVRFGGVRTPQGLTRVPALAVAPASAPGPRISLQPFRGAAFWPSAAAVERCVAQLETARPAAGRSRPHPPAG